MEDVRHFEVDEDRSSGERYWMLGRLQPSVKLNMILSVR